MVCWCNIGNFLVGITIAGFSVRVVASGIEVGR